MKYFFSLIIACCFVTFQGCGGSEQSQENFDGKSTIKTLRFFAWDGITNFDAMVARTPSYSNYIIYLNPLENGEDHFRYNAEQLEEKGAQIWYLLSATTTYPSQEYIDTAIEHIVAYNRNHTNKVLGICFDVEPWIVYDEQNSSDTQQMWKEYLEFVQTQHQKMEQNALELSMVIPSWLGFIPEAYPYNKRLDYEVIDRSDEVVVMDYTRNKTQFVSIVQETLTHAATTNKDVIIALEMVQNQNTQISFYDDPSSIEEFITIDMNTTAFKGYAIHTLDTFVESGITLQ